jgi:hypothetical protein
MKQVNKFTAIVKKPCNVLAELARKVWEIATPETNPEYFMTARIVVSGNDVYMFKPKHQVGVLYARTAGGTWKKVQGAVIDGFGGVDNWLNYIRATESNFRGGPKL